MKKILFIIYSFSLGGGAESLLTTIVNNLDPQKYEISILEIVGSDKKKEPVNSNIRVLPYLIHAEDPKRKEKMYYFYHEWDMMIQRHVPSNFDLYISFNVLRPTFLLPSEKNNNIAWIHGVANLDHETKREERELQREAFYKVYRIISISDKTTDTLRELFPEHKNKIVEIYNGIDIDRVRKMSLESTDIELKKPAIVSVGRLDKNKNPQRLLRVFYDLLKKNNDAHLYYLGYGDLESEVLDLATELNISDRVHFLGYLQNPFPIMRQANVIALLSESEGFPMCILESLALGIPFVTTDIGGVNVLTKIDNACGFVSNLDDELADGLYRIINMDINEAKRICSFVIEKFKLKDYIKSIENIIDESLDN